MMCSIASRTHSPSECSGRGRGLASSARMNVQSLRPFGQEATPPAGWRLMVAGLEQPVISHLPGGVPVGHLEEGGGALAHVGMRVGVTNTFKLDAFFIGELDA